MAGSRRKEDERRMKEVRHSRECARTRARTRDSAAIGAPSCKHPCHPGLDARAGRVRAYVLYDSGRRVLGVGAHTERRGHRTTEITVARMSGVCRESHEFFRLRRLASQASLRNLRVNRKHVRTPHFSLLLILAVRRLSVSQCGKYKYNASAARRPGRCLVFRPALTFLIRIRNPQAP